MSDIVSGDVLPDLRERSLADHWQAVATAALLGVDRRPVPDAPTGPIGDLLAARRPVDGAQSVVELAAALTTVRRAGTRPGPSFPTLAAPPLDGRPVCPPAAVSRIAGLVDEWPELVDEWLTGVDQGGWRLPGDVVVDLLVRFRGHASRRAAIRAAGGELADWLSDLFPELANRGTRRPPPGPEPVPAGRPVDIDVAAIAAGLESGELSIRHRTLLVHAICACEAAVLVPLAEALGRAGTNPHTMGLALSLAALARTRHDMILELTP